jgi:hypothetical protein
VRVDGFFFTKGARDRNNESEVDQARVRAAAYRKFDLIALRSAHLHLFM